MVLIYTGNSHCHMHLGQREELLHTEGWQISDIHLKLQMKGNNEELLSQHLRYLPDIMASHQIKIKGHSITGHTVCFISNQESTKGKDLNINIVNGIHNIKGKTSVNILVSNCSNKHVTFNKGEYIEHLEPTIENIDEEENPHPHKNADAHTDKQCYNEKE